ncbi:hypothetical protein ACP275_10G061400 [Erythranthe tilingii]
MGKPLFIMILLMVVGMVVAVNSAQPVPPTEAQCSDERRDGFSACKFTLIYRLPPSGKCCRRIRETHTECVCPLITPKVAFLINVNWAIKTIKKCGREVPRNFKCGSITTPP